MALDAQGYPVGFQEWWQKNVTNEPNIALRRKRAAEGRQFLDILLRKEQGKITKEEEEKVRKEAQKNANILGIGGPIAAAGATALGSSLLKKGGIAALKENLGGLFGLGEEAAAAEAAQAVAPAVQAGTQAAAPAVTEAATQAATTEGGSLMGLGDKILPGIGAGLSAYGLFKANQSKSPLAGALSGAGLASSGAALLGAAPFAWPVLLGGLALGGGIGALGKIGDKDRFKEEWDRKKKLFDQGLISEEQLGQQLQKGRTKEELLDPNFAPDFKGKAPDGRFVNNLFSQSRKESDLSGEDIQGFAAPFETLGKSYADADMQKKIDFGNRILSEGLVREARGQIDYTDPNRVKAIWEEMANAAPAAQAAQATTQRSSTRSPGIGMDGKRIDYSKKKR